MILSLQIRMFISVVFLLSAWKFAAQTQLLVDTFNTLEKRSFSQRFNERQEKLIKHISSNYSKKMKKRLVEKLEMIEEQFNEEMNDGLFINEVQINRFLTSILQNLVEGNPELMNLDFEIVLSRDVTMNAYCLSNGTIVVNIGLFRYLDDRHQIAAIIAHELSHKVLEHYIEEEVRLINDELQNKYLKEIRSDRYYRTSRVMSYLRDILYESRERSRFLESQADSLGYVLYRNTSYNPGGFIAALKKVKTLDTVPSASIHDSTYRKLFDIPGQSFNPEWLQTEDFSTYDYTHVRPKLDKDSLATHDDISLRIQKLCENFPELKNVLEEPVIDSNFQFLQVISRLQVVPNLYLSKQYGLALYHTMFHLQQVSEDPFFLGWLGKCLSSIYVARQEYKLNRYVDRLDPQNHSESYQRFINFIWNLDLNEIGKLAKHYDRDLKQQQK